ncbi:MAG: hypothetical protein QM635_05170 [Microbacteriaceae bacterium]
MVLPPGFVSLDVTGGVDGPLTAVAEPALRSLPRDQADAVRAQLASIGASLSALPAGARVTDLVLAVEKIAGARFPGSLILGSIDDARLPIPPDIDEASMTRAAAAMQREAISIDFHHGLMRHDVRTVEGRVTVHSLDYLVPVPERRAWLAAYASAAIPIEAPNGFGDAALVLLDSILRSLRFHDHEDGTAA